MEYEKCNIFHFILISDQNCNEMISFKFSIFCGIDRINIPLYSFQMVKKNCGIRNEWNRSFHIISFQNLTI